MNSSSRLRKSATKLSYSTMHAHSNPNGVHLACACREFLAVSKESKSLSSKERSASETLLKWSLKEENSAIKDVVFQTNELFSVWSDCQAEFSDQMERSVRSLQKIQEASKALEIAKRQAFQAAEKEAKLKKDVKKAKKWKKGGDVRLLEFKIGEATREKQLAERHAEETRMEMEVVKMFRFREAMQVMSEAYKNMGEACTAIFDVQQEVANEVPAISTQDVRNMTYTGSTPNRQRVEVIRTRFAPAPEPNPNRRRASAPAGRAVHPELEPPPPYAPLDPSALPQDPGVPLYPSLYPTLTSSASTSAVTGNRNNMGITPQRTLGFGLLRRNTP